MMRAQQRKLTVLLKRGCGKDSKKLARTGGAKLQPGGTLIRGKSGKRTFLQNPGPWAHLQRRVKKKKEENRGRTREE